MERNQDGNMELAYHMHNYRSTEMDKSSENYPFFTLYCSILPLWSFTSSILPA